jgi:hypothetical protein
MVASKTYESEQQAYRALADAFWEDAPAVLPDLNASSAALIRQGADDPAYIVLAAGALGTLGENELLLAGNLIAHGEDYAGWEWMDKCLAHSYFHDQVMDYHVWRPSQYSKQIFNFEYFCSRFSLVIARGSEEQIQRYAQQVYNLIQGGLADACCAATEYVDVYFDMAVCVLRGEWRTEDRLEDRMPIFRELFMSVGDEDRVQEALLACAKYHLDLAAYTAPKNEDEAMHPFRLRCISHHAYELMGWIALYKRFYGPLRVHVTHPMLTAAITNPPPQQPYSDETLVQLYANAEIFFGQSWCTSAVPNVDEVDEG